MDSEVAYPKFRFFVGIAATFAWINIGWVILGFAPLLPFISKEFNVSLGTVMIAVMVTNAVAGGISIILTGPLVDKFGPRKVLLASAILCAVYALLIPHFSHSIMELAVLRILSGLFGHGAIYAGKAAMAQRWFPRKEQGTWIGIWNAGFAVGVAGFYLAFVPLLNYFSTWSGISDFGPWREVGAFSAVPSGVLAILMLVTLFGKEPPVMMRHGGLSAAVQKDFSIALKLPVFWAGAILLGCAQGIMQSINCLTASYMMFPKPGLNWSPFKAGPAMTFIQIGMIASGLLMGAMLLYGFRGSIKWLSSSSYLLAGLAAFFLVMPFSTFSLSHMEISFVIVGFMMNVGYPSVTTFVAQNYPPHTLGKVFGVSGGISVFMGACFSGLGGKIVDWTHTFTAMYGFILAIGVFACILSAVMLNPIKRFLKREAPVAQVAGAAR
jgi:MFS family permease